MRRFLLILFFAGPLSAETVRYEVRPVYSNIGFSIVKWGVLKEEGQFREFNGTLEYDPTRPQQARVDVVARTASLDTRNEGRDGVVKSDDFLDAARYPTLEFHSTGVEGNSLIGNLTIHGVTKPVRFAVVSHGVRDLAKIGKLAGFETTFTINRRHFGVKGSRWGAVPGVLSDEVAIHIVIGAIKPER